MFGEKAGVGMNLIDTDRASYCPAHVLPDALPLVFTVSKPETVLFQITSTDPLVSLCLEPPTTFHVVVAQLADEAVAKWCDS